MKKIINRRRSKLPKKIDPSEGRPVENVLRDRAVFSVLHALAGRTPEEVAAAAAEVAEKMRDPRLRVSASTVRKWRLRGGTKYPTHRTLTAALAAVGKEWAIVPTPPPPTRKK